MFAFTLTFAHILPRKMIDRISSDQWVINKNKLHNRTTKIAYYYFLWFAHVSHGKICNCWPLTNRDIVSYNCSLMNLHVLSNLATLFWSAWERLIRWISNIIATATVRLPTAESLWLKYDFGARYDYLSLFVHTKH